MNRLEFDAYEQLRVLRIGNVSNVIRINFFEGCQTWVERFKEMTSNETFVEAMSSFSCPDDLEIETFLKNGFEYFNSDNNEGQVQMIIIMDGKL